MTVETIDRLISEMRVRTYHGVPDLSEDVIYEMAMRLYEVDLDSVEDIKYSVNGLSTKLIRTYGLLNAQLIAGAIYDYNIVSPDTLEQKYGYLMGTAI